MFSIAATNKFSIRGWAGEVRVYVIRAMPVRQKKSGVGSHFEKTIFERRADAVSHDGGVDVQMRELDQPDKGSLHALEDDGLGETKAGRTCGKI